MIPGTFVTFIPPKFHDQPFVIEAKEKELKNFEKFMAYEIVKYTNQPYITSGWVITQKNYEGVKGCKARLVVHGNQILEEVRTDSPTIRKSSLRQLFFLAAQYKWDVSVGDVTRQTKGRNSHPRPP